ncbi:MAG: peptidoglycan D,D-transpeptidase FtsI family protein [Armatimonadota bacterium]
MDYRDNIRRACVLLLYCFLPILLALGYRQVVQAEWLRSHEHNRRREYVRRHIVRGSILDRDGLVLAENNPGAAGEDGDQAPRWYPLLQAASHVVGYQAQVHGRAGLELRQDDALLGLGDYHDVLRAYGGRRQGHNLITTLAGDVQERAFERLGLRRGAVVAIQPATGEILALASAPAFNPNFVDRDWEQLTADEDLPLLNRATSGLYPPGSAFKVVVAMAALDSGVCSEDTIFTCRGRETVGGASVQCHRRSGHGRISFRRAFAQSCNIAFAKLGLQVGGAALDDYVDRLRLRQSLDVGVPVKAGRLPRFSEADQQALVLASFGQGQVVVTPTAMCVVAATVANGGRLMQPHLVRRVKALDAALVAAVEPQLVQQVVSEDTARRLRALMVGAVREGTGKKARIPGVEVAGKTGTAENETGHDHAWFVAFAPAQQPRAAVAVLLEQAGHGSGEAARVARLVLEKILAG